ncbi:MAG: pentapeptide repeat-containing protein [Actinomycetota bacterium]
MRSSTERDIELFVTKAVAKAASVAGPLLDAEDLEQAARLAVLETQENARRFGRPPRPRLLRRRVVQALKNEIRALAKPNDEPVNLDDLLEDSEDFGLDTNRPALRLVWDGETGDDVVSKAEDTQHVQEVVDGMPAETAQVVRLCFGLDGTDAIAPIDVADILDESPESVLSHLWAAEKLFRHFSADGMHRRQTPMTTLEFQAFREVGDLAWYDLRDLNLNNRDLRNCDLSYAVLSGMNLWGAVLAGNRAVGVNLWGAHLDGADLSETDLRGANLERAGVRSVDLRRAILLGANLWGADLSNVTADRANFTNADLRSVDFTGADLTRAIFHGADLRGADLRRAKLVGADLVGANLRGAELSGTDFRWANLRNSDLCWSNLSRADLSGAAMDGAIRSPKLNRMYGVKAPKPRRLRPVAEPA